MTTENKKEFIRLAMRLEPENLFEDGELNNEEAADKKISILSEWKSFEIEVDESVSLEQALAFDTELTDRVH